MSGKTPLLLLLLLLLVLVVVFVFVFTALSLDSLSAVRLGCSVSAGVSDGCVEEDSATVGEDGNSFDPVE